MACELFVTLCNKTVCVETAQLWLQLNKLVCNIGITKSSQVTVFRLSVNKTVLAVADTNRLAREYLYLKQHPQEIQYLNILAKRLLVYLLVCWRLINSESVGVITMKVGIFMYFFMEKLFLQKIS